MIYLLHRKKRQTWSCNGSEPSKWKPHVKAVRNLRWLSRKVNLVENQDVWRVLFKSTLESWPIYSLKDHGYLSFSSGASGLAFKNSSKLDGDHLDRTSLSALIRIFVILADAVDDLVQRIRDSEVVLKKKAQIDIRKTSYDADDSRQRRNAYVLEQEVIPIVS